MQLNNKLLQDIKEAMIERYPRFGAEIAGANLEYKTDLEMPTAGTDGKNIYFDPNFFESLSLEERLYVTAHEFMHLKFRHMFRIVDKDGKFRDPKLWNIATDAIINANLVRDGFKIKEGDVNMPEAVHYTAEEFYEILLKQKQQQPKNGQNDGQNNQKQNSKNGQQNQHTGSDNDQNNQKQDFESGQNNNQNGQQNDDENGQGGFDSPQKGHNGDYQGSQGKDAQDENQNENMNEQSGRNAGSDDHSLWKKAFEESLKQNGEENKNDSQSLDSKNVEKTGDSKLEKSSQIPEFEEVKLNEKVQFQKNREERLQQARQNLERMREQELKRNESGNIELGNVGESKPILDWRLLLRREVEKYEVIWSRRRSIAENNYAYRLEEREVEDEAETEVMIDVSGSVSLEMVKAFLRQLKPILKESKLKVGCFNEKFWGMVEIKSNKDIDNFKIPAAARGDSAWTEDWDLAVRSFSRKQEVNKIVFTDGEPCPGTMPREELKGTNVIWLVYKNRNFKPCCGKVIQLSTKDLKKNSQISR